MLRTLLRLVVVPLLVGSVALAQAEAPSPDASSNLVPNGSFESGSEGWAWMAAGGAQAMGQIDGQEHRTGGKSFRMSHQSKFAPHVYSRLARGVGGLTPDTAHRVSCWVKGKEAGIAWVGGGPGWYLRQSFPKGTYDWTYVETYYLTGPAETGFELMVACESPTEAVWVDDLSITVAPPEKTREMKEAVAKAHAATLAKLKNGPADALARVQKLRKQAEANPNVAADSYVKMGFTIAERFVDRIKTGGPKKDQSAEWSLLQLEEIRTVLDQTERRIADCLSGKTQPVTAPWPTGKPATIRDGVFVTDVATADRKTRQQPWYFAGYGHFTQIDKDLPNFPALGVSLVQDGRVGPSAMNEDGSLRENALATATVIDRAQARRVKVNFLASPHYFPGWAVKKYPDIANGNPNWFGFSVDHPRQREVQETWLRTMIGRMGKSPALLDVCLSNEPTYEQSARDAHSAALWPAYLKQLHGTVQKLNEAWGTSHESFEKVPVPGKGMPGDVAAQRAYFDWCRFNAQHWADFHGWMRSVIQSVSPRLPTHAKIMVFFSMDRDKLHWGVDPELFCDTTDIAGCDAYAFPGHPEYAYNWHGHEFWYDLLHSFRGQPVFNSENHLIPDGTPPNHVPQAHTRAALWQGALHHQGATTIWVWEEPHDPSLTGSVYFRPANIYGAGQAMFDLARFADEVTTVNRAPAKIALLYSPTSVFWEDAYKGTIFSLYTQLNFLGQQVTFVSEQQLAQNRSAKVDWIILPAATHVTDRTVDALAKFVQSGGKVLAVGDRNLAFDQYHRERKLPEALAAIPTIKPQAEERLMAQLLLEMLAKGGTRFTTIVDTKAGQPAWGVEFRVVRDGGRTLLPVINMLNEPVTVRFDGLGKSPTDLLTGQPVDLSALKLDPMVPMLIELKQ